MQSYEMPIIIACFILLVLFGLYNWGMAIYKGRNSKKLLSITVTEIKEVSDDLIVVECMKHYDKTKKTDQYVVELRKTTKDYIVEKVRQRKTLEPLGAAEDKLLAEAIYKFSDYERRNKIEAALLAKGYINK